MSCRPGRHEVLFDKYHELTALVQQGAYENLVPELDSLSLAYYQLVTDTQNLRIDRMIEIGMDHGVLLFTLTYMDGFGPHLRETQEPADFFKFLYARELKWFYCAEHDTLIRDKTRIGKENYVAVGRKEFYKDYLYWLRFLEEQDGSLSFDLLYMLQLEERQMRHYYSELLQALDNDLHTAAGAEEFLSQIPSQGQFSLSFYRFQKNRCEKYGAIRPR